MNLLKNCLISECRTPISASSSIDSNTDILDMQGYDGVCFIVPITDSDATGVALITGEQNTANSDTSMAALSGATATATCTTSDDLNNTLLILDIYRPLERYVQASITSSTANIAYGTGIAIRYNGAKLPITADSTVQQATSVFSPSEA